MLVACTSDIHVDISERNQQAVQSLVENLNEISPDVFVFAGDVSSEISDIERFLRKIANLKMSKLFVCGNHDVWVSKKQQSNGYNSYLRYYRDIRRLCERYGVFYLAQEPLVISDVGFVGTIGWYDYSTRNTSLDRLFSMRDYESKRSHFGVWNDGEWAYWPKDIGIRSRDWKNRGFAAQMRDSEVSRMLCDDLRGQLQKIEDRVKQAVTVTHMVPFRELVRYTDDPSFDFFSAFIGCAEIGKTILSSKHVTHSIYGHTHFPTTMNLHSVKCICSPIGYLNDFEGDLEQYVVERVKTFKL